MDRAGLQCRFECHQHTVMVYRVV